MTSTTNLCPGKTTGRSGIDKEVATSALICEVSSFTSYKFYIKYFNEKRKAKNRGVAIRREGSGDLIMKKVFISAVCSVLCYVMEQLGWSWSSCLQYQTFLPSILSFYLIIKFCKLSSPHISGSGALLTHLRGGVLYLGPLIVEPGETGGRLGAVGLTVEGGALPG